MPKRQCPFAEYNRPQLKTHIGVKEVNMGVLGCENMKHVYDRTLAMMYQGSRNLGKENTYVPVSSTNNNKMQTPNDLQVLPGQRKLNFNGQLDGIHPLASHSSEKNKSTFLPISCTTCYNVPPVATLCHFCERCLCEDCSRLCLSCQHSYCSSCSTVRYVNCTEEFWCLSCI